MPSELQLRHTAELDASTRAALLRLLEEAFDGDFDDTDWDHALGGVHALMWDGRDLIGHAAVIQRRLLTGGRALRTGYLEAVAVRPDRRRVGHGAAMIDALNGVIRRAYELGALSASPEGARVYTERGWKRWSGATWWLTPDGTVRTEEDDGAVYVLEVSVPLDLAAELTCDYRNGYGW